MLMAGPRMSDTSCARHSLASAPAISSTRDGSHVEPRLTLRRGSSPSAARRRARPRWSASSCLRRPTGPSETAAGRRSKRSQPSVFQKDLPEQKAAFSSTVSWARARIWLGCEVVRVELRCHRNSFVRIFWRVWWAPKAVDAFARRSSVRCAVAGRSASQSSSDAGHVAVPPTLSSGAHRPSLPGRTQQVGGRSSARISAGDVHLANLTCQSPSRLFATRHPCAITAMLLLLSLLTGVQGRTSWTLACDDGSVHSGHGAEELLNKQLSLQGVKCLLKSDDEGDGGAPPHSAGRRPDPPPAPPAPGSIVCTNTCADSTSMNRANDAIKRAMVVPTR